LLTTRHRCNLDVWALVQSREVESCSLVTSERVLSEYNEDLIFYFLQLSNFSTAGFNKATSRLLLLLFFLQFLRLMHLFLSILNTF